MEFEKTYLQENELCAVVKAPGPGQYMVTVTICPEQDMHDVRIFARRRRLYEAAPLLKAGGTYRFPMRLELCDAIPLQGSEVEQDLSVDVTVVADRPCITSIEMEEAPCPVLHLAGDSTVTDQLVTRPYEPETCYAGWGQMLPYYLGSGVAVVNHARSGLTTETFRQKGYYGIVEGCRRPGDHLFLQFGHNDQKLRHLRARGGYRENLVRYIQENRDAGVDPVLVTPLARNTWNANGVYNDLLKANAEVCLELGEQFDVPVLDLHRVSMEFIISQGREAAEPLFVPGDYTHTNVCGGQKVASMVAAEMKRVLSRDSRENYRRLADQVLDREPCDLPRLSVFKATDKEFHVGMTAEMLEEVVWASENT